MDIVEPPMDSPPSQHSRWFDFRLAVAVILLVPAIWFSWKTVDGLAARRLMRTDLAEISNARYGILSADQWRSLIGPMLNAQVDKLDLKGQSKTLRPMVERSLYALLDSMKTPAGGKAGAKAGAKATGKPGGIEGMFVNKMIDSLRPHVPEYANVVMAELGKAQTQKAFSDSIRGVLAKAVANTFGNTDMTTYNAILKHYGCSDGATCEETLGNKIAAADTQLNRYYRTVLASAALGFILLMAARPALGRGAVVVLMLFCLAMLAGGVLSPMLEVEVRVTKIDATLLGTPIEFRDQSLYYRSKTVFEVFETLIHMGRPEMTVVGVLVILFSVVFPTLKMLALAASLFRPALLRTNRFVKVLAFELSKWSMADVMVLAIFMSFVAFNGVIGSAFDGLRTVPNVQQVLIPTNASKILPGYYLFIGFCVGSIVLSRKLQRGIASSSASASS
ncbi:MAG: paraquat-inducible protein A [Acidobacteriaceae bacterium]